ncbi:hypothetical protein TNCV_3499411 [Trichonephila clavipes]|nr:hypothetical protein TNCV_3499411 [Trichonephila clavipes]
MHLLIQGFVLHVYKLGQIAQCRASSTEVSEADCYAVGPGFDREGMGVCKYIGLSQHGSTLNIHRAANPLMWLVESPRSTAWCSLSNLGWNRAKSYCHLNGAQSYS